MKPEERQQSILGRLRALQREWKVDELSKALKVSPLTIRRDLDILAGEGAIVRTLGGCIAAGKVQNSVYQGRIATRFEDKQAIGRCAAEEVGEGNTLIINDGSTTFHLASYLDKLQRVTVYTNSIAMVGELSRFSGVRLFVLGGEYQPDLFYLGGSLTERILETIQADIVFLGTDAIDSMGRCLVTDPDVARTTQMMLRRGKRKILLADASKIGVAAGVAYANLSDFDLWITSGNAPKEALKKFEHMIKIRKANI